MVRDGFHLATTEEEKEFALGGMAIALYYLGLASLFTHELDAVTHAEWRLLFVLRSMPNESAASLFVAIHIPLFFLILWLSHHQRDTVRRWTRRVVAGFLVVHAVLHFTSSDPEYDFDGALSRALIGLAAACGIAYLLTLRQRSSRS